MGVPQRGQKNRNFLAQGQDRDKRRLGRDGRNVLRRDGRAVKVCGKPHPLAERVGRLPEVAPSI